MSISFLPHGQYVGDIMARSADESSLKSVRSKSSASSSSFWFNRKPRTVYDDNQFLYEILEEWTEIRDKGLEKYPHLVKQIIEHAATMDTRVRCWLWCFSSDFMKERALRPKLFHAALDEYERNVLTKYNTVDVAVRADLHRTLPHFPLFQSRKGLDNLADVLQAVAVVHESAGYCQGMNFIGAAFIQVGMLTEDAFWLFHKLLMSERYMAGYFEPEFKMVMREVRIVEELLNKTHKATARHMKSIDFDPYQMFVLPWFLTLFFHVLPWDTAIRFFDLYVIKGRPFLFSFTLAIFSVLRKRIKSTMDWDGMATIFQIPSLESLNVDGLITEALAINIKLKDIKKLEEKFGAVNLDSVRRINTIATAVKSTNPLGGRRPVQT
eukprot:ANDGO_08240.mRNA.1 Putative GTPase-activating protein AN11010